MSSAVIAEPNGLWRWAGAVALVILGLAAITGMAWWARLWVRRRRHGSAAGQATYRTIETISRTAPHLRGGVTSASATKAARDLRLMLGITAVAFIPTEGEVAWDGMGRHHQRDLLEYIPEVVEPGRTIRLDERHFSCPNPDCPVRGGAMAPVVAHGRLIGVLACLDEHGSTDIDRATSALAAWIATQSELADLAAQRERVAEAELRALRAQIDPHFIYNSLSTIAALTRTQPERARELLLDFADFTRYSLRGNNPTTSMGEEIGNVEKYLDLERARLGERLQVGLSISPTALRAEIPHLVIQPLVENAVKHGISRSTGLGRVSLTAQVSRDQRFLTVEVKDNGAGADPDSIAAALAGANVRDSLGLSNIHARLRHTFGPDAGLQVSTAPDAGMTVRFTVPWAPVTHHWEAHDD